MDETRTENDRTAQPVCLAVTLLSDPEFDHMPDGRPVLIADGFDGERRLRVELCGDEILRTFGDTLARGDILAIEGTLDPAGILRAGTGESTAARISDRTQRSLAVAEEGRASLWTQVFTGYDPALDRIQVAREESDMSGPPCDPGLSESTGIHRARR